MAEFARSCSAACRRRSTNPSSTTRRADREVDGRAIFRLLDCRCGFLLTGEVPRRWSSPAEDSKSEPPQ
jgi:hypothetical protein